MSGTDEQAARLLPSQVPNWFLTPSRLRSASPSASLRARSCSAWPGYSWLDDPQIAQINADLNFLLRNLWIATELCESFVTLVFFVSLW